MNFILLSLILAAPSAPFELTTLDEQTVRGELTALTDRNVALRTADGDVMFDVDQLLAVAPAAAPAAADAAGDVHVELADGSTTQAANYSVKSGQATIALASGETLTASARRIRAVRFLKQDDELRRMWSEIAAGDLKGDAVVVRKGGEGKPPRLDFLEGAIRDVSDATVLFEFEGDLVPIKRAKVQIEGLLYYQSASRPVTAAVCRIDDNAGGRWFVSSLRLSEDRLQFSTPAGVTRTIPLASVKNFDFSLGKIAYLSDLEPVKKTWRPYFASANVSPSAKALFDVRRDRTFSGDELKLDGQTFRKGLAVCSRTELVYRLPGEFSRFQVTVGIDPAQKNRGNVRLQIRADNRLLYDEAIAGDAAPEALQIDISGAGRLTLLVDYGEGWDIGDQLLLGGARVIR